MTRYNKLLTALAMAAVSALSLQVVGGQITQVGIINVGLAVLGAAALWYAAEVPGFSPYAKAIMAGLFAGAAVLNTLVGNGSVTAVTPAEWGQIGLAVLNAAVQLFVKNSPLPASARRKVMDADALR